MQLKETRSLLFDDSNTADVQFICSRSLAANRGPGYIHAHSKIISHLSEYFKTCAFHSCALFDTSSVFGAVLESGFLEGIWRDPESITPSTEIDDIDELDSDYEDDGDSEDLDPPVTSIEGSPPQNRQYKVVQVTGTA